MKSRTTGVIVLGGAVVGLLAAALLSGAASLVGGPAIQAPIDTGVAVAPEQCAPCHYDIGDVRVKGLTFSHGNHLLVSCEGCHFRMPHRSDMIERVSMGACFTCHGVKHGVQGELASGKCAACHTDPDKLRPVSHGITWAKKPHAEVANASGVNRCMMCHEAIRDCDECHVKQAPEVADMPLVYHPMVLLPDKGPSVRIDPTGPVSMSQCAFCHGRIDEASGKQLIFAHTDHIERNYRCEACHPKFPHTALGTERPDMLSCYRCHGLSHNSHGQVATEECTACHPATFEFTPYDHTKKFIEGAHKDSSKETPEYCAMCHKSKFCVGCHRGEKVSPNAPGKQIIPADHEKSAWLGEHGPLFLAGEGLCASCHDDPSCTRCHKTVMPHPVGWVKSHSPEPGISQDDCTICHAKRDSCQACHHKSVAQEDLIASNCTPCHEEMKTRPATKIKQMKLAEHAVHFDVAKKKKRPYQCYDCHFTFGRTQGSVPLVAPGLPGAAHDLRMCYDCHGALDYRNRQIAPWRGRELCIRCHTDLHL